MLIAEVYKYKKYSSHQITRPLHIHMHEQDSNQDQFLSRIRQAWIQNFLSPWLFVISSVCRTIYPLFGGEMIEFIPSQRILVLCKIQSASLRIWTRVDVSHFHYTGSTLYIYIIYIYNIIYIYIYIIYIIYNIYIYILYIYIYIFKKKNKDRLIHDYKFISVPYFQFLVWTKNMKKKNLKKKKLIQDFFRPNG